MKIYTVLDQGYETKEQAIAAQTACLEAGYSLSDLFIEEYEIGSDDGWKAAAMLAEQRNALIDFCGRES